MKKFDHLNATTVSEAFSALDKGKAKVIAGGTDLINTLKDEILPDSPETLVNIKTIPDMNYIREEKGVLKIGALALLNDIACNATVKEKYTALAEAAGRVASPNVRNMGTIGGSICQINRCWYYWVPNNRFYCMLKGGKACPALTGDNRYHSIFGAMRVNGTPCSTDCPADVDIPSYLSKIRDGDLVGAAKILLNSNPFPAITGRVCPHFCESECTRGYFDEPISIRGTERFIGDYILENAEELVKSPQSETRKIVAIVGSGPTGLSAAYYLRRLGHSVTVFEAREEPGGLLTYGIPPYRLPKDVVSKQIKALEGIGIQFKLRAKVSEDTGLKKLMNSFDAVFLACGAWKEKPSGVKGEQLMTSGLDFLLNSKLGKREVPGKKVAVVGGGNVAIDVARTLLRLGAEPVIIYRRSKMEMPAVKEEVNKAEEEGIKIQFLTQPVAASKKDSKIIVTCIKMRLGPSDETGRPQPVSIEGSEFTIEFDAVMKAIGEDQDTSTIPREFLDEKGRLKVHAPTNSLGKNVFAGGDFVTGPSTVVAAIAAGRKAAGSIDQYFTGKERAGEEEGEGKTPLRFNSDYLIKTSRAQARELPISERSVDVEDVFSLDQTEVETEANRCFNCGCVAVNASDIAPALIALDAKIKTTKRVLEAEKFFAMEVDKTTVLDDNEIVTEIQIPASGAKSAFIKFALRKAIDFPIMNCAVAINGKISRICLNGVFGMPYRARAAEDAIVGKSITEATAETAGEAAVSDALALTGNKYKVQIAKVMVKRALLACK